MMLGTMCCSSWLLGNGNGSVKKVGQNPAKSKKKEKKKETGQCQKGCKSSGRRESSARLERALEEPLTSRDWWQANRSVDESTKRAASVAYSITVETSRRAAVAGGLVDLLEQANMQFQRLHDLTGEMDLELEWANLKLTLLHPVKMKLEREQKKSAFSGSLLKIVRSAALQLDETICVCSIASSEASSASIFVKSDSWFAKWAAVQDEVNKASDHLLFAMINDFQQSSERIVPEDEEEDDDEEDIEAVQKAIRIEIDQQNEAFIRAVISASSILSTEEKAIYTGMVLHSESFGLPSEVREAFSKIFKKLASDDLAGARHGLDSLEKKLRHNELTNKHSLNEEYPHRGTVLLARGLAAYRQKNDDEALRLYHDSIISSPDSAECWFAMAVALHRGGHSREQQVAAYKRTLELDKSFALAHLKYGLLLAGQRAYEAAESELELAARLDSNNSEALLAFAEFQIEIKQNQVSAEKYLLKALQVDPRNARAHNSYAMLLLNFKQNYFLAEKHLRLALEADSCYAIARNNYAHLLYHIRKNYDDAEMHYRLAVEADPKLAIAHYNYANLLKNIRCDYDLAQKHYELAIQYEPNLTLAHNNLANLFYDIRKDPEKAQNYYELALSVDPNNVSAHTNLGLLKHVVRQQFAEAEKHYKRALAIDPKHADAHNNLGYLLQTVHGKYDLAEEHYRAALENDPDHAFTHESYGELLFDVHHAYDDAEKHLKLALEHNPNLLTAHLKLCELYLHVRDDPESALDYAVNALELDATNTSALQLIATLYEQRGALNLAADYLERLVAVLSLTSTSSSSLLDQKDTSPSTVLSSSSVDDDAVSASSYQFRGMLEDANKRLASIQQQRQAESVGGDNIAVASY